MTASANGSSAASSPPSADRYFNVDGERLRYRDQGTGPPVLMIHGWTLDLEMWEPQIDALRDSFRLVRVDRRGHGLSSGTPDPERDSADLACLCRHLGLTSLALVGMSQGARSVLRFASAASQRIYALILDGPPSMEHSEPDAALPVGRFAELARTSGIHAFRREWAAHPLMTLRTGNPHTRSLLAAMIDRYPGRDLTSPAIDPAVTFTPISLQSIIAPTLILTGEYDLPNRVRAADGLAARLASAERAVIACAGHLPNLDNPQLYNELCRAFLVRHSSSDLSL